LHPPGKEDRQKALLRLLRVLQIINIVEKVPLVGTPIAATFGDAKHDTFPVVLFGDSGQSYENLPDRYVSRTTQE